MTTLLLRICLEMVDGLFPWVFPIVVALKKIGIRICVDMRAANEAIELERYPVPNVEDLILDLNGSTVFSKIDLNQGYHQMELDEDRPKHHYLCHTCWFISLQTV